MPLITRRSSTRAFPRVSQGRCAAIFANCPPSAKTVPDSSALPFGSRESQPAAHANTFMGPDPKLDATAPKPRSTGSRPRPLRPLPSIRSRSNASVALCATTSPRAISPSARPISNRSSTGSRSTTASCASSGINRRWNKPLPARLSLLAVFANVYRSGAPKGNRTPVFAVKGRRPGPLDDGRWPAFRLGRNAAAIKSSGEAGKAGGANSRINCPGFPFPAVYA
jgi:hypothetical protein